MTIDSAVRKRISELLKQNDTNISKVSLKGGLTPSTLYDFMRGTTEHIQLNTIKSVCQGFGIKLNVFFDTDYFDDFE
ncbi:MAG: helix-turn-helix domain-containing protein [Ruminococcaceae bacterium]|nr:helix-turn-helix domain-containing protein [Oscillospiraceae bacterium]